MQKEARDVEGAAYESLSYRMKVRTVNNLVRLKRLLDQCRQ